MYAPHADQTMSSAGGTNVPGVSGPPLCGPTALQTLIIRMCTDWLDAVAVQICKRTHHPAQRVLITSWLQSAVPVLNCSRSQTVSNFTLIGQIFIVPPV